MQAKREKMKVTIPAEIIASLALEEGLELKHATDLARRLEKVMEGMMARIDANWVKALVTALEDMREHENSGIGGVAIDDANGKEPYMALVVCTDPAVAAQLVQVIRVLTGVSSFKALES